MAMSTRPDVHADEHGLRIAALQAGDLAGGDRARAETLRATCAACADLFADLEVLRAATHELPAPRRTRDFRLSGEDAARLRPRGWRRLLDWLAAPSSTVRPLATGLASLGVAGLLVASMPGFLGSFGSAGAAPVTAPEMTGATVQGAGPAAATGAPALGPATVTDGTDKSVTPPPADAGGLFGQATPGAVPAPSAGGDRNAAEATTGSARGALSTTPGPSLAVVVSLGLLAAGICLFLARWAARRLSDG
jgi:hypothetical protein